MLLTWGPGLDSAPHWQEPGGSCVSVPEQPSHDQHREWSVRPWHPDDSDPVMMTVMIMMMFRPETEVLLQWLWHRRLRLLHRHWARRSQHFQVREVIIICYMSHVTTDDDDIATCPASGYTVMMTRLQCKQLEQQYIGRWSPGRIFSRSWWWREKKATFNDPCTTTEAVMLLLIVRAQICDAIITQSWSIHL